MTFSQKILVKETSLFAAQVRRYTLCRIWSYLFLQVTSAYTLKTFTFFGLI